MLHNAIKCAICQHPFFSTLVGTQERIQDLVQKLSTHLSNRHTMELGRTVESTKSLAGLVVQFIFIHNLAVIPDENATLIKYAEELQDQILASFGYDPTELEDEEDEEGDDLIDDLNKILDDVSMTDDGKVQTVRSRLSQFVVETEQEPLDISTASDVS
jgi:hypothetical protein